MTPETIRSLSESIYRIGYLVKMIGYEFEMMKANRLQGPIKNALSFSVQALNNSEDKIKQAMPMGWNKLNGNVIANDEKIRSLSVILGRLAYCTEEEVAMIEQQICENIIVK
jgi:hypothetical protein